MKNHRKTKRLHYGLAGVLLAMLVALGMVILVTLLMHCTDEILNEQVD